MKVITNKTGGLAINPRTVVYFKAGDAFEVGTNGLSEDNLNRLIELKLADISDQESVTDNNHTVDDGYAFESFTDKDELELYAMEIYNVELDKRKSLKKMIAELKETIEKELENDK